MKLKEMGNNLFLQISFGCPKQGFNMTYVKTNLAFSFEK